MYWKEETNVQVCNVPAVESAATVWVSLRAGTGILECGCYLGQLTNRKVIQIFKKQSKTR